MSWEYLLALGVTLLALLARAALDPFLGEHLPYVTFFVAVAVTTFYAGAGPSLTAVVLGALAAEWLFMSLRRAITVAGWTQQLGVITEGYPGGACSRPAGGAGRIIGSGSAFWSPDVVRCLLR